MMALYDQIQELRAELATNADEAERRQIEAELAAATAEHEKEKAEFEAWFQDALR